jgi:hypothetical protein
MTPENMDLHLQECIRLCWECRDICQDTLYNHNLERGGDHIDAQNIRLMTDCIEICQTAADLMRRHSMLHRVTCQACAEICDACAESCEKMGSSHTMIQRCAEACRRCATSCRAMSSMKQAA